MHCLLLVLPGILPVLPQTLLGQCNDDVSAGPDQFGCTTPTFAVLEAAINGPYLSFAWTPTSGMVGANTLTPSVTVNQPTQYILRAKTVNTTQNLIENGDFEQGLAGFTSQYVHNPGFLFFPWGTYDVVNVSPYALCNDNSGSGNLLAVDGADVPNLTVWCQTVNVTPNTEYQLSAWISNIGGCSPLASIEFNINGTVVGIGTVPAAACTWVNFSGIWNSGNTTSATICLEDIVVTGSCNDFGVDDIALYPICTVTDTVLVQPINVLAVANPNTFLISCEGAPITLNGNGSSTGPQVSYLWDTFGGNIVSGETTLQPTIDASGVYTLNVTYDYGSGECTKSTDVQVTPTPNPLTVYVTPPQPLGCPGAPVNLSAVASQGAVSYFWSTSDGNIVSGANTANPTVNAIGTYEVLVTNIVNGCTATASVNTILSNNPLLASIAPPSPIGCGGNAVTLIGSANQGGVGYSWSTPNGNIVSGQNTGSPVVDSVGVYVLQVTNNLSGCTDTAQTTVGEATNPPLATAAATGMITCIQDTVHLSGAGSSAGNNITYAWSSPNGLFSAPQDTLETVAGAAGLYVLAVTNTTNNCTTFDTIAVAGDTLPPVISFTPSDPLTCVVDTLTLQADIVPSSAQLVWVALGGGVISSGDSTANPQVIAAGQYQLTALNVANGCSAQAMDTVVENRIPPTAQAQSPDTINCITPAVTLRSNGSSSGNTIRYQWTGGNILSGANGPSPIVDAPDWYTLLVTDTLNGCTASAAVLTMADTARITAVASAPDTLTCGVLSVLLRATGSSVLPGLQYTWSTTDGQVLSGADTDAPLVGAPGIYTLLLANPANGCTAVSSTTVVENTVAPSVQIAAPQLLTCSVTNQTLEALNTTPVNALYTWMASNGGNITAGGNSPSIIVDAPGLYTLRITDPANACTDTESVSVSIDTIQPAAFAATPGPITCANPQITLSSAGSAAGTGISYNWSAANGGQIVSGGNTPAPVVESAGSYQLVVTNAANGCSAAYAVQVAADLAAPVFSILPVDSLTCVKLRDTLMLDNPVAGFTYLWQTTNGVLVSGQNTPSPVVGAPGTYTVNVINPANGCDAVDSITVYTDSNVPAASIALPDTLTCAATSVVLPGSGSTGGNFVYAWSGSGIVSGQNTLTPTVNQPGTYQLTVENTQNGCTAQANVPVGENKTPPAAFIAQPDVLTCTITSLVLSGQPAGNGYAYAWTAGNGGNIASGAGSATPLVDAPGTYTLTATNQQNGCSDTAIATVSADVTLPTFTLNNPVPLTCNIQQISLLAEVLQPATGFVVQWSTADGHFTGGQNTLNPGVDAPGSYALTVQNQQNGCVSIDTLNVVQNITPPTAVATAVDTLTCLQKQVSLDGAGSSTGAQTQYNWSGPGIVSGATGLKPVVDLSGWYVLSVTDQSNGCSAADSARVTIDTLHPLASIAPPGILTCVVETLALNASASNSGPAYRLQWSGNGIVSGSTGTAPVVNQSGTYTLLIEHLQNGCTNTASVLVQQNQVPPVAEAGNPGLLHCNQTQTTLSGSGTPAGLTYAWTSTAGSNALLSGANTPSPTAGAAGLYVLTVTRVDNGCTDTDDVQVTAAPEPAFTYETAQPNCMEPVGSIEISASANAVEPLSYAIHNGQPYQTNALFDNLQPGTYTPTLRDAYGCTTTASVLLTEPVYPSVQLPPTYNLALGDSVILTPTTVPPAAGIAEWAWTPALDLSCADCPEPWAKPLLTQVYNLRITDFDGCSAEATTRVLVDRGRKVYAPNIFSPDDDGRDDRFILYAKAAIDIESIHVYDRWGSLVWQGVHLTPGDESAGWDGRVRGDLPSPGVYVWQARIQFVDGQTELFEGDVTVIR